MTKAFARSRGSPQVVNEICTPATRKKPPRVALKNEFRRVCPFSNGITAPQNDRICGFASVSMEHGRTGRVCAPPAREGSSSAGISILTTEPGPVPETIVKSPDIDERGSPKNHIGTVDDPCGEVAVRRKELRFV